MKQATDEEFEAFLNSQYAKDCELEYTEYTLKQKEAKEIEKLYGTWKPRDPTEVEWPTKIMRRKAETCGCLIEAWNNGEDDYAKDRDMRTLYDDISCEASPYLIITNYVFAGSSFYSRPGTSAKRKWELTRMEAEKWRIRQAKIDKLQAIVPWNYQSEAVKLLLEYIDRRQNTCYQLPTGGGKTIIFRFVIQELIKTKTVLFLVPQIELVNQAMETFLDMDPVDVQDTNKLNKLEGNLFVGCREKCIKRAKNFPHIDVLIVDEAHRSVSQVQRFIAELGYSPVVIGLTATPENFELEDSGCTLADLYGSICSETPIHTLTDGGYLAPIDYKWHEFDMTGIMTINGDYDQSQVAKAIDRQKLVVDAGLWLKEHPESSSVVMFMPTVKSAASNCDYLNSLGIGSFEHVEGDMPKWKRKIIYDDFRDGKIRGLISRDILTYGFDAPIANCGMCFRAIKKSRALYLQILGRVTRLHEKSGKKSAVFYDYVNNASRFHGESGELYTEMKYNPDWNFFGVKQKRHFNHSRKKDRKVNYICPMTKEKCVSHKCQLKPDSIEKWFKEQKRKIPACCYVKPYFSLRTREDELGVPHAAILPRQELAMKSVLYGKKPSRKKVI